MAFRRVLPLLVVAAGLLLPAKAGADDVESQVMGMINAGRSTPLILHSGLASEARGHSQYMASTGNLNHDNADERVNSAAPDPAEGNGAPDDGFATAAWCENATYVTPAQGDPARSIYNNWKNSAPHNACMNNTGKNVGAVGIYWDGTTWWATFVAEVDHTPPGGNVRPTDVTDPSQPTKQKQPETPVSNYVQPTQAPVSSSTVQHYYAPTTGGTTASTPSPSPTPHVAKRIEVQPDVLLPGSVDTTSSDTAPGFGMQEAAGLVAALVFGCLLLERRLYVPPEFAWHDDEPVPERDLVGAGVD